jgi:hypothetical protein
MGAADEGGAFDRDAVQKALMKCKSGGNPANFAFGLAGKPEECGLMIHLRKPGSALKKQMKSAPGIRKACFGTLTVVGPDILLRPTRPLKGMVKQLKRRLREEGMVKFNPVLVDEEGNALDEESLPDASEYDDDADAPETLLDDAGTEEDEDEADDASEDAAAQGGPASEPAHDPAALKARLMALGGRIKALGAAAVPQMSADLMAAAKKLQGGDLPGCAAGLDALEGVIAAAGDAGQAPVQAPAQPEMATKLKAALAERIAVIRGLPEGPERAELGAMAKKTLELLNAGDLPATAAAFKELVAALQAATASGGPEAAPAEPAAVVDVLGIWREAKESVDDGISKLQSALRGYGVPALERIAEFGLNGVTEGNQTALAKALFDFRAATGADRPRFASALAAQVGTYAQFLSSDPVIELVENNPCGVAVPLRATLGGALREIAKACKAAA